MDIVRSLPPLATMKMAISTIEPTASAIWLPKPSAPASPAAGGPPVIASRSVADSGGGLA